MISLLMVLGLICPAAPAAPVEAPLRFGMSAALTGAAADLGTEMRRGIEAAFAEANVRGGVNGRSLELVALDDGYEPARTARNVRWLIEEEEVLALVGNVGTPTAIAAIPIANETGTLLFGAFTGAGVLRRTPLDRHVINFRASYAEETAEMIEALVKIHGVAPEEIAFFTQRDGYGDAGFTGGMAALREHGLTDESAIVHTRYTRNTDHVEEALAQLLDATPEPRAVIMVGAYQPCAFFIRLARESDFNPLFLNISFVGSQSLAALLGSEGDGVVITQVVPPLESDLPIVHDCRRALRAMEPPSEISFVSLEGFIVGRLLLAALEDMEVPVTRASLVDALESLGEVDIGLGFPLELSAEDHQASHRVWPTVIHDGQIEEISWEEIAEWDRP